MKPITHFARPLAVASVIAVAGMAPAFAADAVDYEEPPVPAAPVEVAPVSSWTGPYFGLQAGYGFLGRTHTPGADIDTDGFVGGAFGGFNVQNGSFVYGGEADIGYNGMKGDAAGIESRSSVDGSLRARLGFAPNDALLIYGTAGGAADRTKITDAAGSDSKTMLGYTAGVGVDAKLTEQIFGRVEYRYTDYGNKTFNTGSGAQQVDTSGNKIQLGIGMKF